MIKEVKLKSIYINEKKADGTPYIDKNGNSYKLVVIENEAGHKASMFCGKFQAKDLEEIKTWKSGDVVKINLEQDGKFTNFSIPNRTDELQDKIANLELRVSRLEGSKESKDLFAPEEQAELNKMGEVLAKQSEDVPTKEELAQIPF
jgi:hypothetical protein